MKHKTPGDEQFPVAGLLAARFRPLVNAYYHAARFADDVADNPALSSSEKHRRLDEIRRAFLQPSSECNLPDISELGRMFVRENLDASLFLDLLTAFEKDAGGGSVRVWEELVDYCRYSAAPVGRFLLAVHNESPSAYLAAEQLCVVLQLVNHLGDIKKDLSLLNRCYIPLDMMERFAVRKGDFGLASTTPEVAALLKEMLDRVGAMLAEAFFLPPQIRSFRLRFNICVILSLTNSVLQKYKRADFLQNPPRLNTADRIRAFVSGSIRAVKSQFLGQGRVL